MKKNLFLFLLCFFLCSPAFANQVKRALQSKFALATAAFQSGQHKQALALYKETLEIYPKFAPSYYFMAMTHVEMKSNPEIIIELLEKTVEIKPDYAEAHDQLGRIYYSLGNYEDSERHSLGSLKSKPNTYTSQLTLGWTYLLGQSKPEKALSYFQKALAQKETTQGLLGLGMTYYLLDERGYLMETITRLRQKKAENYAVELEQLARQSYQGVAPSSGNRLFETMTPRTKMVRKQTSSQRTPPPLKYPKVKGNERFEKMSVRLSGKFDGGYYQPPQAPQPPAMPQAISGEDRIKQLQQRSQMYDAGSMR